ncbi:anaphase-promoting complex, cyclosome, subunit 4-domain-containing protein [Paraphysoderma sedebokerense]|nr:anaphase-promoting complex, cyclosome, subunit 4-domain-containing protein [Paraphysoderma sedebokerense]
MTTTPTPSPPQFPFPFPTLSTTTTSFTHEHTGPAPKSIQICSWCPTLDLLALGFSNGSVNIVRLNLQVVWGKDIQSGENGVNVARLGWSPNGKILAIAYSNGLIRLYDIATQEFVHQIGSSQSHSQSPSHSNFQRIKKLEKPTSLSWFEKVDSKSEIDWVKVMEDNVAAVSGSWEVKNRSMANAHPERYLPKLGPMTTSQSGAEAKFLNQSKRKFLNIDDHDEDSFQNLNVLVCGDRNGNVVLSAFGNFPIGQLSLSDNRRFRFESPQILQTSVAPTLSHIYLLVETTSPVTLLNLVHPSQQPKPVGQDSTHRRYTSLVTCSTSLLQSKQAEIKTLAELSTEIRPLLNYVSDTLAAMEKEYRGIHHFVKLHRENFEKLLENEMVLSTPETEFLRLLLTGTGSTQMQAFLTREVDERALERWGKMTKDAYVAMSQYIVANFLPAMQRIIIYLNDLLGYSRWEEQYAVIGLTEKSIIECIKLCGALIGRLEELKRLLGTELDHFMSFISWLEKYQRQFLGNQENETESEEPTFDVLKVVKFIENSLTTDIFQSFFESKLGDQEPNLNLLTPYFVNQPLSNLIPPITKISAFDVPRQTQPQPPVSHGKRKHKLQEPESTKSIESLCYMFPNTLGERLLFVPDVTKTLALTDFTRELKKRCEDVFGQCIEKLGDDVTVVGSVPLMRCIDEYQYIAITDPEAKTKFPQIHLYRVPLYPPPLERVQSKAPVSPTRASWKGEYVCLEFKPEEDEKFGEEWEVRISDFEFFDDEVLSVLMKIDVDQEKGVSRDYVMMVSYVDQSFHSFSSRYTPSPSASRTITQLASTFPPPSTSSTTTSPSPFTSSTTKRVSSESIDQGQGVDIGEEYKEMPRIVRQRYVEMMRCSRLVVNGNEGRRVIGVVDESGMRVSLFLVDEDEDEDEEDERLEDEEED